MPKCVPFQPIVCKSPLQTGGNDSNALSTHVKACTRPRRGFARLFGGVSSALVFLCLPAASVPFTPAPWSPRASLSHSRLLPGHQGQPPSTRCLSLVPFFPSMCAFVGRELENAGVDPHGSLCAATWGKLISRSSRHGRQRITETEERAKNTD